MANTYQLGGVEVPYLGVYLSGTAIHPAGGTVIGTAPAGCQAVYMRADGAAYYAINGTAAGTASPGHIPANMSEIIPNISNLTTISFNAAAGVTVYVQYYSNIV